MKRYVILCLILLVLLCGCATEQNITETDVPVTSETYKPYDETTAATETVTEAEAVETAEMTIEEIIASYGEWFLSPIDCTWEMRAADRSGAYDNWSLKTPRQVNVTRGELEITFDFFRGSHRIGESMQVRVTVKNTSDEPFPYRRIWCFVLIEPEDSEYRFIGDYTRFRLDQTDDDKPKELPPNSETVFEYLFVLKENTYTPKGTLTMKFFPITVSDQGGNDYVVEIPLECSED